MTTGLPTLYPSIRAFDMQQSPQDHSPMEMSLRDHLLAAGAGQPNPQPLQQHPVSGAQPQAIDPAISGSMGNAQYPLHTPDGAQSPGVAAHRGRRELSNTKRAAQNRAAQRAFRQRKEEYIRSLEARVKEHDQLVDAYSKLTRECHQLRDYIINLQNRLLAAQGELPPLPDGIDLHASNGNGNTGMLNQHTGGGPSHAPHQQQQQHDSHEDTNNAGLSEDQISELQVAAQAAAAASAQQHSSAQENVGHQEQPGSYDVNGHSQKGGVESAGQQVPTQYPQYPNYEAAQSGHSQQ